jgi:hypothetical protein
VHEDDYLGGKTRQNFSTFSLFSSVFVRTVDVAPDVDFRRSLCPWKAYDTLFLKFSDLREGKLGSGRYGPANRCSRNVFPCRKAAFPIEIPAKPRKILAI